MRLTLDTPFVLIDDARAGGSARLYRSPQATIRAVSVAEVPAALDALRRATGHRAGYIAYEAGAATQPRIATPDASTGPLLWFGIFDTVEPLPPGAVDSLLPDPAGAWVGDAQPLIDFASYARQIDQILGLIRAGDIYQANLTFAGKVPIEGDPLAAYAAIRARAAAGHGGIVWTGEQLLLSFSPELFFAVEAGTLTARPMKGTAPRGASANEDSGLAAALAADAKQRAENLMIVDLMRNDLARVALPGSVAVPALFAIETYPTVHQMVSTVTARLASGRGPVDALTALFPCGSITGAPKVRAMQVIADVERTPRGAYTGAIGWIDPAGDAGFNVAIRTLALEPGHGAATIGLGSGIVADSQARDEWAECLAKAAFLTSGARAFDLIETMAFDPAEGLLRLGAHLARIKASADRFGFAFDRHAARNELQAATFRLAEPSRVRLLVARSGAIAVEAAPAPPLPTGPVEVAIVALPVDPADFRLRHKTSDRAFYDTARAAGGGFEVVFERPDGWLTEGSFTNLFVERDGMLVTPPAERGLLPGVLRGELIASGRAIEGDLRAADLAGGFFIGNALRGLIPARLVARRAAPAL